MSVSKYIWIGILKAYKHVVSPWMGAHCRFTPTCSEYAMECFRKKTTSQALVLILKRLWSCRPGGRHGYDPVP